MPPLPNRPSRPPPTLVIAKAPPLPPPPSVVTPTNADIASVEMEEKVDPDTPITDAATTTSDHEDYVFVPTSPPGLPTTPPPIPQIQLGNSMAPEKRAQLKDSWSAVPDLPEHQIEAYLLELVLQFPKAPSHNPAAKKSKAKVVKESLTSATTATAHTPVKMMKAIKSWGFVGRGAKQFTDEKEAS